MTALLLSDFVPRLPLGHWVSDFVNYITNNFSGFFAGLTAVLGALVSIFTTAVSYLPSPVMIIIFAAIAWLVASWRVALLTVIGLLLILSLNLCGSSMETLGLVIASTVVSLIIGIPLGILASQYKAIEVIVRPILDFMQTMPAYVYLLPAIILLGLGNPPALIAVVVFATPPAVRLTMLGIQQVSAETVEAAQAFGATAWQTLIKVKLPQAFTTIMAGVNQVIMLALSMVVIAALIGAGGLGANVYQGLQSLNVGQSFEAGLGIVIIAIVIDRITRHIGAGKRVPRVGKGGNA